MTKFTDSTPMPFGEHKGKKMEDVPASYLLWLYNEFSKDAILFGTKAELWEYIDDNKACLEIEAAEENPDREDDDGS